MLADGAIDERMLANVVQITGSSLFVGLMGNPMRMRKKEVQFSQCFFFHDPKRFHLPSNYSMTSRKNFSAIPTGRQQINHNHFLRGTVERYYFKR